MLSYGEGGDGHDNEGGELSPKPMTPRRVKRRSVMARGSHGRQSSGSSRRNGTTRSNKSGGGERGATGDSSSGTYSRSSMRNSRRKYQQNPVTKLLDQQQQLQQHYQPHPNHPLPAKQQLGSFHQVTLNASNLHHMDDIANNTNQKLAGSLSKTNNHYYNYRKNIPLDPIYYNTNGPGLMYDKQALEEPPASPTLPPPPPPPPLSLQGGHYNQSYQHSTNNLQELSHADELYNNRPPSVRSSYSNFHGSRPLSTSYVNTTENVFAGLSGASNLPPPPAPCTPPLYQQHPLHQQQQQYLLQQPLVAEPAPTFVAPQQPHGHHMAFGKRTASRESIRSMAFLNNGPPAYNLNYHTPPDSETTM